MSPLDFGTIAILVSFSLKVKHDLCFSLFSVFESRMLGIKKAAIGCVI